MSKLYFSYDPLDRMQFHDTEESAKAAFEEALQVHEDLLADGDASDSENEVSWGKVSQKVEAHDRELTEEEKAKEPDYSFIRTLSTEDYES